MAIASDVLERIGNTALIELQRIKPDNGVRILVKLESENPTGSMKDRMALAIIKAAEADGRLKPGGSVVEYTGGSTGVSLALVCAVQRLSIRHRDVGCLRAREAFAYGGAGRTPSHHQERIRTHDREAYPRHDRRRGRDRRNAKAASGSTR